MVLMSSSGEIVPPGKFAESEFSHSEKRPSVKYAKDYKCCMCNMQAEVFWPCCDPDIDKTPYCRKCVKKQQVKLMIAMADNYLA